MKLPRMTRAITGLALSGLAATVAFPVLAAESPRQLTFPPLREVKIPESTRFELDNGLIVYLLEDHEFPMVEVRTLTRGGTAFDPEDRIGLADMMTRVMRTGGGRTFVGDALDERIERLGTNLNLFATEDAFLSSLSTLTENLNESLDILTDVLLHPGFPEDKLDEARKQERTAIASRNDEPLDIAIRELAELVYGADSPYGWHTEYATIDGIDPESMRAFHARFFHPDRTIVVAWGDLDADGMRDLLSRKFADWSRSPDGTPELPDIPTSTPSGLFYAEKKDVTQSTILVGGIGIRMDDPIYPAAMVLQQALGGGFGSRLFNEIRTRRGLAYAAGCMIQAPFNRPGTAAGYVMTQADSTTTTLRLLLHEMERVIREPMTDEEVERAKDALLNSFVFEFDSPGEVVLRQARFEFNGYDSDFLERYQEQVRSVTPADVQNAARTVFRPDDWKVLVVGNRELFAESLSDVMPVSTLDISIPSPAASVVIPAATPAALEAGRRLVAAAIGAHGGAGALNAVRNVTQVINAEVNVPGMALQIGIRDVLALPDRLWVEQSIMGQKMTMVVDGDGGWRQSPQGISDLTPEDVEDAWSDRLASGGLYFLQRASSLEAQALEPEEIDGVRYDVVYVRDSGDQNLKVYLDPDRHLIARVSYDGTNPMTGAPAQETSVMSDYRPVDSIQFPYEIVTYLDGELFLTGTVSQITVNDDLSEAMFEKP